jgi:hypothetical protein
MTFHSTWRCGEKGALVEAPFSRDLELITKQPTPLFEMADEFVQSNLTVLLFTSPVPSHPSSFSRAMVHFIPVLPN